MKALAMKWEKVTGQPTPELVQYRKDSQWFSDHYAELKDRYADNWVGVYKQEVVGASPDGMTILDELEAEGFDVGHVFFHYIHSEEHPRIFGSSIRWYRGIG